MISFIYLSLFSGLISCTLINQVELELHINDNTGLIYITEKDSFNFLWSSDIQKKNEYYELNTSFLNIDKTKTNHMERIEFYGEDFRYFNSTGIIHAHQMNIYFHSINIDTKLESMIEQTCDKTQEKIIYHQNELCTTFINNSTNFIYNCEERYSNNALTTSEKRDNTCTHSAPTDYTCNMNLQTLCPGNVSIEALSITLESSCILHCDPFCVLTANESITIKDGATLMGRNRTLMANTIFIENFSDAIPDYNSTQHIEIIGRQSILVQASASSTLDYNDAGSYLYFENFQSSVSLFFFLGDSSTLEFQGQTNFPDIVLLVSTSNVTFGGHFQTSPGSISITADYIFLCCNFTTPDTSTFLLTSTEIITTCINDNIIIESQKITFDTDIIKESSSPGTSSSLILKCGDSTQDVDLALPKFVSTINKYSKLH